MLWPAASWPRTALTVTRVSRMQARPLILFGSIVIRTGCHGARICQRTSLAGVTLVRITDVVVLITQRSQFQIPPPLPARHGLEGLIRLLELADRLEYRGVEWELLLTKIKVTERAQRIGDQPCNVRSLGCEFGGQIRAFRIEIRAFRIETGQLGELRLGIAAEPDAAQRLVLGGLRGLADVLRTSSARARTSPRSGTGIRALATR